VTANFIDGGQLICGGIAPRVKDTRGNDYSPCLRNFEASRGLCVSNRKLEYLNASKRRTVEACSSRSWISVLFVSLDSRGDGTSTGSGITPGQDWNTQKVFILVEVASRSRGDNMHTGTNY
jgi:hypothetical protein